MYIQGHFQPNKGYGNHHKLLTSLLYFRKKEQFVFSKGAQLSNLQFPVFLFIDFIYSVNVYFSFTKKK
jgi:hypothetical protein